MTSGIPLQHPTPSITIAILLNLANLHLAINVKPRSAFWKPRHPGKSGLSAIAAAVNESPRPPAISAVQSQAENASCWK